ncbi:hypothetical protein BU23DRAFT_493022, partial [Bimuria novae-zelandiae CBS 107.79]
YYVKARYIYNINKKSFILGIISYLKRIFSRASYRIKREGVLFRIAYKSRYRY